MRPGDTYNGIKFPLTSSSGTRFKSSSLRFIHLSINGGINIWRYSGRLKAGPTESASVPIAS